MSKTDPTVIVYAKRTPIGSLSGSLSSVSAPQLGGTLIKDAIKQLDLATDMVDAIYMGQVLTAGVGQAPARQAALAGGLKTSVCATTINRVCGSGLKTVMMGDLAIRTGEEQISFCGGQENMSLAPHLLPDSRTGFRFGDTALKDHMLLDGLWDPYANQAMGHFGDLCSKKYDFSRAEQDEFAISSYQKARKACEEGKFSSEIVPVEVKTRKGSQLVEQDESPFAVDLDKMDKLKPAFAKDGTVTAANASSLNDGAAICLLMPESVAKKLQYPVLAKITAQASYAFDPEWFTTAPIGCIEKLLTKTGLKTKDIDLFEINEAFSCVTMAAIKELNLPANKVNIHGGAVSLGHPIGASGARVLVTLIHALRQNNLKTGLATLCIGGGEASGMVVEIPYN